MGVANIGHPVPHCFIDGLLECCLSCRHADDFRSQKSHPCNIERLALHVDGPHVDAALETEACGGCRRGDAMLSCPRLGDDPPLAHSSGKQDLADGIVDLVSARVEKVFTFEVNLCATQLLGESLGKVKGRGSACKLL